MGTYNTNNKYCVFSLGPFDHDACGCSGNAAKDRHGNDHNHPRYHVVA